MANYSFICLPLTSEGKLTQTAHQRKQDCSRSYQARFKECGLEFSFSRFSLSITDDKSLTSKCFLVIFWAVIPLTREERTVDNVGSRAGVRSYMHERGYMLDLNPTQAQTSWSVI